MDFAYHTSELDLYLFHTFIIYLVYIGMIIQSWVNKLSSLNLINISKLLSREIKN